VILIGTKFFMYEFAVTPAVTQIRRRGVEICGILPGTIAAELELEPGDRVMRVNGRVVRDYLDFRFQTAGETELTIDVRKSSGEDWELNIERDESEDFGINFEQIVPRQCATSACSVSAKAIRKLHGPRCSCATKTCACRFCTATTPR